VVKVTGGKVTMLNQDRVRIKLDTLERQTADANAAIKKLQRTIEHARAALERGLEARACNILDGKE
jgi:multidrug resistance efflux pump